eukprot:m.624299 g.624299  ORF g.624299 m.624299 type:complete len:135 (+) comp22545_c0_seq78:418-822(+)
MLRECPGVSRHAEDHVTDLDVLLLAVQLVRDDMSTRADSTNTHLGAISHQARLPIHPEGQRALSLWALCVCSYHGRQRTLPTSGCALMDDGKCRPHEKAVLVAVESQIKMHIHMGEEPSKKTPWRDVFDCVRCL